MTDEIGCYNEIQDRLKAAGEWVYSRGRPDHPCFKSAAAAAARLISLLPPDAVVLSMRDQALRALREAVLESGRKLIIPDDEGTNVYEIPEAALYGPHRGRNQGLRIHPPAAVREAVHRPC